MPTKPAEVAYDDEIIRAPKDPVSAFLQVAIVFVVLMIVAVGLYGVIGGVFSPPAPRTQAESLMARSRAAVQKNKKDGEAWAQLARVQYLGGDKRAAWETIALARRSVEASERPILWVNNQELDMLIRDGRLNTALKKAEEFVKKDAQIRVNERASELSKGIDEPLEAQNTKNTSSIELFLLKAEAETRLKKYKLAVKSYDNALLMTPMASDILSLRGWAKLEAGDRKGAKTDFETALKYLPEEPRAQAGLKQLGE